MSLVALFHDHWAIPHRAPFSPLTPLLERELRPNDPDDDAIKDLVKRVVHLDLDRNTARDKLTENENLFIAAFDGDQLELERIVVQGRSHGQFPAAVDGMGNSALHYAVLNCKSTDSSTKALRYLLGLVDVASWITHANSNGMTPLMSAVAVGNEAAVRLLAAADCSSAHINHSTSLGCTALHIAIDESYESIATMLVDNGAQCSLRAKIVGDEGVKDFSSLVNPLLKLHGATAIEYAILKRCSSTLVDRMISSAVRGELAKRYNYTCGSDVSESALANSTSDHRSGNVVQQGATQGSGHVFDKKKKKAIRSALSMQGLAITPQHVDEYLRDTMTSPHTESDVMAIVAFNPTAVGQAECDDEACSPVVAASVELAARPLHKAPLSTQESQELALELVKSIEHHALDDARKKAISRAMIADGHTAVTLPDIEAFLKEMVGEKFFTRRDVLDVGKYVEDFSSIATVLNDDEAKGIPPGGLMKGNKHSPHGVVQLDDLYMYHQGTFSLETLRDVIAEEGCTSGLSRLAIACGYSTDNSTLHNSSPKVPVWFARMMNDLCLSMVVSAADLFHNGCLQEFKDPEVTAFLSQNSSRQHNGILLVTKDIGDHSLSFDSSFQCLWIIVSEGDMNALRVVSFQTKSNISRSIAEMIAAKVSVVALDEAIAFGCFTKNRHVVDMLAGASGIIPYASLFHTFHSSLLHEVLKFRSRLGAARRFASPLARLDLLTAAVTLHEDSFVMFLVSCARYEVKHHHLITAAKVGTAAAFQAIFAALGSSQDLLSDVEETSGESAVTAAISSGTCMHLTSLLQLAARRLSHRNRSGYTPLIVACLNGNEGALLHLISLGADVNQPADNGMTPLLAAILGPTDRTVMSLVRSGASVTRCDVNGLFPLMAAEYFSSSTIFPLLREESKHDASATAPKLIEGQGASTNEGEVVAPSEPFQPLVLQAATIVHSLECYMTSIAPFFPELRQRSVVNAPRDTIVCRPHAIKRTPDGVRLLMTIDSMLNEFSAFTRANLLEPQIRVMFLPDFVGEDANNGGERKAETRVIDEILGTFVSKLRETLSYFQSSPPGEAPLLVLVDLISQMQLTVRSCHRFAAFVRYLLSSPSADHPLAKSELWLRTQRALPPNYTHLTTYFTSTNSLIMALAGVSIVFREDDDLQRCVTTLLDPCSTGITSLHEFGFVFELLDGLSNDAFASLQYLLKCREVYLLGCEELAEVWLTRSVANYVVVLGPVGATVFTWSLQEDSRKVVKSEYRDVRTLLDRESAMLKRL